MAYAPPELTSIEVEGTKLFDGPPLLAVEILSPNDTYEQISEKVKKYLQSGTKLVWVVDPDYSTVTVHESGCEPVLYNRDHELTGGSYLPGFRMPVRAAHRSCEGFLLRRKFGRTCKILSRSAPIERKTPMVCGLLY